FPSVLADDLMSRWQSDIHTLQAPSREFLLLSGNRLLSLWQDVQASFCWLSLRCLALATIYASCRSWADLPFAARPMLPASAPGATSGWQSLADALRLVCLVGSPFRFLPVLSLLTDTRFASQQCIISSNLFRSTT